MRYGKLIDGRIEYAPESVVVDQIHYNPYPPALARENGYKPIITEIIPDDVHTWKAEYIETSSEIHMVWRKEDNIVDVYEEKIAELERKIEDLTRTINEISK